MRVQPKGARSAGGHGKIWPGVALVLIPLLLPVGETRAGVRVEIPESGHGRTLDLELAFGEFRADTAREGLGGGSPWTVDGKRPGGPFAFTSVLPGENRCGVSFPRDGDHDDDVETRFLRLMQSR